VPPVPRTHAVVDGGKHPKWSESFSLSIADATMAHLAVVVRDSNEDSGKTTTTVNKTATGAGKAAAAATTTTDAADPSGGGDAEIGRFGRCVWSFIRGMHESPDRTGVPTKEMVAWWPVYRNFRAGPTGSSSSGVRGSGSGRGEYREWGQVRVWLCWMSAADEATLRAARAQPPIRYVPGPGDLLLHVKQARRIPAARGGGGGGRSGAGGMDVRADLTLLSGGVGGGGVGWRRSLEADEHASAGPRWSEQYGVVVVPLDWDRDRSAGPPVLRLELFDQMVMGGHALSSAVLNLAPHVLHPRQPSEVWYRMKDGSEVLVAMVYLPRRGVGGGPGGGGGGIGGGAGGVSASVTSIRQGDPFRALALLKEEYGSDGGG
jgi:hypothetical protein